MKNFALVCSALSDKAENIQSALSDLKVQVSRFEMGSEFDSKNFDALVLVLEDTELDKSLISLIQSFHDDSSPIGAFYNSPLLVAKALKDYGVAVTADQKLSAEIESLGTEFIECEEDDFITDRQNKVVSTPPNMNSTGLQKAISELFEMS